MKSLVRTVLVAVAAVSLLGACHSLQAAAANDPQRCERDPNCKSHQRAFDCSTQCTDDPACVERCSEIQQQTGTSDPH
jgi:hypothetical protein